MAHDLLERLRGQGVVALRLHFTDLMGVSKSLEVPLTRLPEALSGRALFDGSALQGFARNVESDVVLNPDPATLLVLPSDTAAPLAWMLCDIALPDGTAFSQCPRTALRRVVAEVAGQGLQARVGAEVEFFLFQHAEGGAPSTRTSDAASYFDFTPADRGEAARQSIVRALESAGIRVEASHHECAPGQHEVDLAPEPPLRLADNLATLKLIARRIALDHGLHATFMPKPVHGVAGSGLHLNFLLEREGANALADAQAPHGLSAEGSGFIAGLVRHAPGMAAVTNPLVNSYKRLVPGWEAPTHVAWSEQNKNPLVRVPSLRGQRVQVEFRMPDPSGNPYLTLAVALWAGLHGIRERWEAGPPINTEIERMSGRERGRLRIHPLPGDLAEALDEMKKDVVVREALGEEIFHALLVAKRQEWGDYIRRVHRWEIERYLAAY